MATLPTRLQRQAFEHLAEALYLITQASRLDDKAKLSTAEFAELAGRICQVSSAFDLDQIVARTLERRGQALGLSPARAELITLLDAEIRPLEMVLLSDQEFQELLARTEAELGGP